MTQSEPKTVFITGASSGIGRATAHLFHQKGWNVVASMRSPDRAGDLANWDRVLCPQLDVTDPDSIQAAVSQTLEQFAGIDVLINNAGYGLVTVFEAATPEQIEQQFATNVFGLMAVTRSVLPHLRDRGRGLILNVSSIGGQVAFPLYSLYHATKWAVEGFSESLRYELESINVGVKLIEPGPIRTDFYERSVDLVADPKIPAYQEFVAKVLPRLAKAGTSGSPPEVTAQIIYRAATDGSQQLRYPAGGNAGILLFLRKLLPDWAFSQIIRQTLL